VQTQGIRPVKQARPLAELDYRNGQQRQPDKNEQADF